VLEWVYGTIVSTAEKARDGAKRQLGLRPPTAQAAFDALLRCLEDQHTWEQRARNSKELLNNMLQVWPAQHTFGRSLSLCSGFCACGSGCVHCRRVYVCTLHGAHLLLRRGTEVNHRTGDSALVWL
jgi:hypothetical protein